MRQRIFILNPVGIREGGRIRPRGHGRGPQPLAASRGLVLLDVLLALVLFSLTLTFLVQSLSESCRALVYSQDYSAAVFLAEDRMAGILARGEAASGNTDLGTMDFLPQKMDCTAQAAPLETGGLDEQLEEVSVTVAWPLGGRTRTMVLKGIVFHET